MSSEEQYDPSSPASTPKNLRVLDIGSSDGYWLSEVLPALAHPETCALIGTDITPERFLATPPRWLILTVQNSLGPWPNPFLQSFDLVHQRLVLLGTGTQFRECVLALTSLAMSRISSSR
ncbi:hypothetical protein BJX68DRAFT_270733 [Aspergillus pseudodeflectus]|uniref:Methyltransferase domain-containing protein n=1 Tax=Aspergillus pseudodeflectus TaxID=176178 RepID=A0ABR4JQI3_9EURO